MFPTDLWKKDIDALQWRVLLPTEYGRLAGLVMPAVSANRVYVALGTILHERGDDGNLVVSATNLGLWLSVSVPVEWPAEYRFSVLPIMQSVAVTLAPQQLKIAVDRLHVYVQSGLSHEPTFLARIKHLDAESFPVRTVFAGWKSEMTLGWLRLVYRTRFAVGKESDLFAMHATSADAFATDGWLLSLAKASATDSMRLSPDAVQWIVRNTGELPDETPVQLAYSSDNQFCRIAVNHLVAEAALNATKSPVIDTFRSAVADVSVKMPGDAARQIARLANVAEHSGATVGVLRSDSAGNLVFCDADEQVFEVIAVTPAAPPDLEMRATLHNLRRVFQAVDTSGDVLLCHSKAMPRAIWLEDAASRHWCVLNKPNWSES